MDIKGFAIGENCWGQRSKQEIRMKSKEMPTLEEMLDKLKFSELKVLSLEGFEKRHKVADLDWIGDVDSCEADEIIAWENRMYNHF